MLGLTATAGKALTLVERSVFENYDFHFRESGIVTKDEVKTANQLSFDDFVSDKFKDMARIVYVA